MNQLSKITMRWISRFSSTRKVFQIRLCWRAFKIAKTVYEAMHKPPKDKESLLKWEVDKHLVAVDQSELSLILFLGFKSKFTQISL